MRVLVTGPSLKDQGGVAGYYNALLPFLKHEGIAVSYLEIGGTHAAGGILSPLVDQLRFRSALRRFRPHLVHINPSFNLKSFLRGGFFIRGACRVRAGLPVLVFFRGWRQGFEHAAETRYRTFFTRTYGKAAAVIVLGRAIEQKLRAWGVTAPIHVEHTVVAEELLAGFSLSERLRGFVYMPPVKILFLATLLPAKGIFELLEAVSTLRKDGYNVILTIAGAGPAERRVKDMIRELAIQASVTLTGDVRGKAKRDLFLSHHLYCLPSWDEGLPASLLEALALGMPVVATPVGGIPDIIDPARNGVLVPPRDPAALARALAGLCADPARLAEMARANHEFAAARFPASRAATRLADIYRATLTRTERDT